MELIFLSTFNSGCICTNALVVINQPLSFKIIKKRIDKSLTKGLNTSLLTLIIILLFYPFSSLLLFFFFYHLHVLYLFFVHFFWFLAFCSLNLDLLPLLFLDDNKKISRVIPEVQQIVKNDYNYFR